MLEWAIDNIWNLIALAGFVIAIWQIRKTKNAASAAQEAANTTRATIHKTILLPDISACIKTIEEVQGYIRNEKFELALLRVIDLSSQLIQARFALSTSGIDFKEILTQLGVLKDDLENKINDNSSVFNILLANKKLSEISNSLNGWIGKAKYSKQKDGG